jgi:hypothetical protein
MPLAKLKSVTGVPSSNTTAWQQRSACDTLMSADVPPIMPYQRYYYPTL